MDVDLLRNKNENAPLGPFDGRVAATVRIAGETYFVTTNATYIPELPEISKNHAVYYRPDTRFGPDDPTLWPQQYSAQYCHLAAMPRRETCYDLEAMWYTPTKDDFDCALSSAITRNIGRLKYSKLTKIYAHIPSLKAKGDQYIQTLPPTHTPHPLYIQLFKCLDYGINRLKNLPMSFEKMLFTVTCVQRHFLELTAFLEYMMRYKPRIDLINPAKNSIVATTCVGAFTADPQVAQELFNARLPFWLVRPLHLFAHENILKVVPLTTRPDWLMAGVREGPMFGDRPIYTGNSTNEKILAMHATMQSTSFYRDLFDAPVVSFESPPSASDICRSSSIVTLSASSSPPPAAARPKHRSGKAPQSGPIRPSHPSPRSAPYEQQAAGDRKMSGKRNKGGPQGPKKVDRDPFAPLVAEEMPQYIPTWTEALQAVDKTMPSRSTKPSDKYYVLPEPALFASPADPERRRKFLHHWCLLRDVVFLLLDQRTWVPLSNQEWRDVLEGLLEARGHVNSRTGKRSRALADVIRPLVDAGHVQNLESLPVSLDQVPSYSLDDFRREIWRVAETNFRYELVTLDLRASGQSGADRIEEGCRCFPGGQLEYVSKDMATLGFASADIADRSRYFIRLGQLMLDWQTHNKRPAFLCRTQLDKRPEDFTAAERQQLEVSVALYYTQTFYEFFGRAAVLPMRLS